MAIVTKAQSKFVYPFLFDDVSTFSARSALLNAAKVELNGKTHPIWKSSKYSEQDLLPHVAKYINAEENREPYNVAIWKIGNEVLQSPNYGLGSGENRGGINYKLVYPNGQVQFVILSVELYLFRTGMGAIVFEVSPNLPDQNLGVWFDFLSYFRFFGGYRRVFIECTRAIGYDQENKERIVEPFFPPIAKRDPEASDGSGLITELIAGLLDTGRLPEEPSEWWKDIFIPNQFLPFSIVFIDESDPADIPDQVYQYRKMLHSRQVIIPPKFETSLNHDCLHAYAKDQWFVFSLDGGGFIAFDPPDSYFFKTELPIHLMDQYFLVFILTIHQRFILTHLADEVVHVWLTETSDDKDEYNMLNKLLSIFKAFASLGNYNQVMQRDNLHQVYQKWQAVFQIDLLYQSVNQEIQHISNYLQSKQENAMKQIEEAQNRQTKRLERQINVITLLIGVPAILFSFFQMGIDEGWTLAAFVLLGGLILGGMIMWIGSKEK